jgi:HEAT repeat protein
MPLKSGTSLNYQMTFYKRPLIQALKDEHWDVRRKAAWALGNTGDARAIGPLIQALRDEYPDVRRQAARSLAVLTVLSEEIAKSMIHDYELNLEEQDRNAFEEIKKLYEQELKKLQAKSSE